MSTTIRMGTADRPAVRSPFTTDVILTLLFLYGIAFVIIFAQIGPWEAIRAVAVNGLLVIAWLVVAHRILADMPLPAELPLRRPAAELAWSLAVLFVVIGLIAVSTSTGQPPLLRWLVWVAWYGGLFILYAGLRYPLSALGLVWPGRRGWLALLAVIALNVAAGILYQFLPEGELESQVGVDLAQELTGPVAILAALVGTLLRAALPEELLLRVTLLPRLARFLPLGWAILLQALLFSAGHLPQKLLINNLPWLLAIAYTLPLDNGLIAGYLWHRQHSLPLLILLHLFAFVRFG